MTTSLQRSPRLAALGHRGEPTSRPGAELLAYLALATAVALPIVLLGWGKASIDTSPRLYFEPWKTFTGAFSTWDPTPSLGQQDYNVGIAPVAVAVGLIKTVTGSVWLTTRLWRLLLLLVAAAGAARLFHRMAGEDSTPAGRVAAAACYALNPYALVGAATNPILLPYALLPWLVLALDAGVRRARSWRPAAAFAAVFFAMSGVNAGVVPFIMLLSVPCYLCYVRLTERVGARILAAAVGRAALLALGVSLYWLVPSLLATGAGSTGTSFTESPRDVAATSSWTESLRGLGFWVNYGKSGSHPWAPAFVGYCTNAALVVASLTLPVVAALAAWRSRAKMRAFAVMLLGVGMVAMVGMFPPDDPTPVGRLIRWSFEHLPGAVAFRTTNKAGALPALGVCLLVALGATNAARRLARRSPAVRAAAGLAAVAILALTVLPRWTGGAVPNQVTVPDYWRRAAADLNAISPDNRVLMLPGQTNAVYRWGDLDGEDVSKALFDRGTVARTTFVPGASVLQANYLAAATIQLQEHWTPGAVATMARYLGASDVLLRNDLAWERFGGAHPAVLADRLQREPGLTLVDSYGALGQHTGRPPDNRFTQYGVPARTDELDALVPPLQRYLVDQPREQVRAEPAQGTVLIDGDNFALPALSSVGLLTGQPPFRLLGATSAADLGTALRDGGRIVLTDSNRRRTYSASSAGASYTPTLSADDAIGAGMTSLSLFDPDAQSVIELAGARRINTSLPDTIFGLRPSNSPGFAFDGDPDTAWTTGPSNTAVGQWVSVELTKPRRLSQLTLRPQESFGLQVAAARLHVGDRTVDADLSRGQTTVRFPATTAGSVRVEITAVRGSGDNEVGFAEIAIPGVKVTETVRLPRRFQQLVSHLDADSRDLVARAPLDVVLDRQGDPNAPYKDEEPTLNRKFWLPDGRSFTLSGRLARGPDLPDDVVDRLVGTTPAGVAARSSSRLRGDLSYRASQAADGNPLTAWTPGSRKPGEWIQLDFPSRTVDHVTVSQLTADGSTGADMAYATGAELSFDGGAPVDVQLGPGTTTIPIPPREAHSLRLRVTSTGGSGQQPRISELQVGGVLVPQTNPLSPLTGCTQIATVDGRPVLGRFHGTLGQLNKYFDRILEVPVTTCDDQPLVLGGGSHEIRSAPGWLIDTLRLASPGTEAPKSRPAPPTVRVDPDTGIGRGTGMTIRVAAANAPYYLMLGQGYDPRWTATLDGHPLGPPILTDGYSVGWRIDEPGAHQLTIGYQPHRVAVAADLASLLALIVVLMLAVIPPRTRPTRRQHHPSDRQ
jgi:arabinofuranan 3-O-arabinosyltransferase